MVRGWLVIYEGGITMNEQKSNEVCCINCKYLTISVYIFSDTIPHTCNHLACYEIEPNYIYGKLARRIRNCGDLNKNLNCPHYKRKWWKFWIRF